MSIINATPLLASAGGDYQISRSVRLRSSATAYFNRTFTTPTDNKKWTMSMWLKRGSLGGSINIFGSVTTGGYFEFRFNTSDQIYIQNRVSSTNLLVANTTAVYRDPSAWYHIVFAFDSANATAANRNLLYVNGVNVALSANSGSGDACAFNSSGNTQYIGNSDAYTTFDGYMTEVNFIDGQALTPSSFGAYNAYGVWTPTKYNGTYGNNGFYLNFSDNSGATSTTIGKDYSGNGNNWTPNNISVTSGSTYDSMLDVPTPWADGGNGRGNYAVLNRVNQTTYGSLSDGNLKLTGATDWGGFPSSIPIPKTGKWYAEFVLGSTSSNSAQADCGIFPVGNTMYYDWSNSYGLEVNNGFFLITNGSFSSNRGGTTAGGTVFQIAVDADSGKVWFGVNNAWYDTYNTTNGNPSAGTNPSGSGINFDSTTYQMAVKTDFNNWTANFGQRPFSYTPPTGFKALNTQNLPDSTIKKGSAYFDVKTHVGYTVGAWFGLGTEFDIDMIWVKNRTGAYNHVLVDSVRGDNNSLASNTTAAENTAAGVLLGRGANSKQVYFNGSVNEISNSGQTYVDWCWKKGATQGFDIVTYTGNGSASQTLNHSLGVAPALMITKQRGATGDWFVYHKNANASPQSGALFLELTNAFTSNTGYWNNTAPTSSQFTVGSAGGLNANGVTAVAYLFAEVAGYSAFGTYTGNGSADGPFVYLGFRPRFVMIKRTDSTSNWWIENTANIGYNTTASLLSPNTSDAEYGTASYFDLLSNGFKLRQDNTSGYANASGGTYIYAAFAENPFRYALAR